jgi:hypothetical protein
MITVVISSVSLAFENPLVDPKSNATYCLTMLDYITTWIFCFELVIKVIAAGFLFNG